jgi:hypothetical protein
MGDYGSWLPGRRDDQLAMAKTWVLVLGVKGPAWGVPQEDITELDGFTVNAEDILGRAKSSTGTPKRGRDLPNSLFTRRKDIMLTTTAVKMTIAMIVTIPVLLVYPFFQRYFVKGIMIGAVRG